MNLKVSGNQKLNGTVIPSGSKNSAVALIPATLMFKQKVILKNVPDISDVDRLLNILLKFGSKIVKNKKEKTLEIDNSSIGLKALSKEDLGNMRGTALFWGPLLARFSQVSFKELPGGCTLGARSLMPHYKAFKDLGVEVNLTKTGVSMNSKKAKAKTFYLSEVSPTVTENILMLACSVSGTTKIYGAACEPNVRDLCEFLVKAGADIKGAGSNILEIIGPTKFKSVEHEIVSDVYEIATFLAFGACTGGDVSVSGVNEHDFKVIKHEFEKFNIDVSVKNGLARITGSCISITGAKEKETLVIRAQPWPFLPVDLLPIFVPIALKAKKGSVLFHNWMYEGGLFWTNELTKLSANVIMADPHRVIVTAGRKLKGATLEAPYIIRAVVSMVLSAMISKGNSLILNADAIHRGHPNFVENLRKLGAKIEEV